MNDAKHTKGPWEVGEWITSQSHAVYKLIHGVGRSVSAVCVYGARKDGTKSGKRNVSVEECDANARLIAAAPDLLAACEDAPPCPGTPGHFPINPRDCHDWFTRYWNWQKQREAAIRKAEGR